MITLIKRFFIFFIIISLLILYFKREYFSSKIRNSIDSYSSYSGLVLNEVYVTGRINETKDKIIDALKIEVGDPINSFNINNIRKRINDLSWVNDSKIHLRPFGQLDILLFEHIPYGVVALNKDHYLIDKYGIKIKDIESSEFTGLFRLYGEGSVLAIKELPPIIQKLKQLKLEVLKVERIDLRRWNVFINKGFYLKLPNLNPLDSLYPLNNDLDYNDLDFIDLRIENRISLKYNKN